MKDKQCNIAYLLMVCINRQASVTKCLSARLLQHNALHNESLAINLAICQPQQICRIPESKHWYINTGFIAFVKELYKGLQM